MCKNIAAGLAVGAVMTVGATTLDDYEFLVKHMPEKDRGNVSEAYLWKNVALAQEARATAPWRAEITDEIFREYVLPYSSIGEDVDDWRPLFRQKFWPLVKDCKTAGEAVALITSRIWEMLDVKYSTKREKSDQSPFHSMRIHMASCTGLAIIYIDAYRACGIPARFTGCNWTPIPGNHSWVEYYENGSWHFFDDVQPGVLLPADEAWFKPYAAIADGSNPRTKIYATRWSPNKEKLCFWATWRGENRPSDVPADDVTASYARFRGPLPQSRISFVARNKDGLRVPVEFRLVSPTSGKVMAEGKTFPETADMNNHCTIVLPARTMAMIEVKGADGSYRHVDDTDFEDKPKLIELKGE